LTLMNAKKRAQMLQHIRAFFEARNIMEVTTPILSQAANNDVYIQSVQATFQGAAGQTKGYLHTSPEFAMKRLLAAYQTPLYQICQV
ncbi:amino acid--tRNA ligase-related protein, partial [Stenotrophomonas maltophilia]|uniref:amino acid--tRNA ligase-related protein n=1 Tax=Stenotrophomonas maltophilia TaxID=40324 RepID=UPI0027BA21F5